MKNRKVLLKSVFASVLGCAAGFATADTQNLALSAVVSSVCKFTTTAQTLGFTIDPSAAGTINGTGASVAYKCTKGTTPTSLTLGNGSNFTTVRNMKSGIDVLPYALSVSGNGVPGNGFGTSAAANALTFTSSVAALDYQNLPAGTYTDTVLMTLLP